MSSTKSTTHFNGKTDDIPGDWNTISTDGNPGAGQVCSKQVAFETPIVTPDGAFGLGKRASHLLTNLSKQLWAGSNKLADIDLKVDGQIFRCHKLILLLSSPYFKRILKQCEAPLDNCVISIPKIDAQTMANILRYIYTGCVNLDVDNCATVLEASTYLELTDLNEVCIECLSKFIDSSNCLKFWRLAKRLKHPSVVVKCEEAFLNGLSKAPSSAEKVKLLSSDMLMTLMNDDKLPVGTETEVCDMLLNWLKLYGNKNLPYLETMLSSIRWSNISQEYFEKNLMTNRFLTGNPRCAHYLANVSSFYKDGIPFKGCKTFCRQTADTERCVVLVGIRKRESSFGDACVISLQRPVVSSGTTSDNTNKKTMEFTAANVHHNCLYVAGLGPAHDEIWTCDLTTGWTKCAHMLIGRRRHCTTFVGNDLFSLGGHNDSQTIPEVESFNVTENTSKMRRFLNYEVRNAACLALKGIIYVFGGVDRQKKDILKVQMYDTQRDICTTLERQMPRAVRLPRVAVWGSRVFLVGPDTCLLYNIHNRLWCDRSDFKATVGHFGLVIENERMYIIGGGLSRTDLSGKTIWTCQDEVKYVDLNDVISNQLPFDWKYHCRLPRPRVVHTYATLTLPTIKQF